MAESGRFTGDADKPDVAYFRRIAYDGGQTLRRLLDIARAEQEAQLLRRALSEVARG